MLWRRLKFLFFFIEYFQLLGEPFKCPMCNIYICIYIYMCYILVMGGEGEAHARKMSLKLWTILGS